MAASGLFGERVVKRESVREREARVRWLEEEENIVCICVCGRVRGGVCEQYDLDSGCVVDVHLVVPFPCYARSCMKD